MVNVETAMDWCNAGHTGVIQHLTRRGFYLTDVDDVEDIENLLMMSDQLHHVSILPVKLLMR